MPRVIRALIPIVEDGEIVGELPTDISEQCARCKHWTQGVQCKAFMRGIPQAIMTGKHSHRRPFPGDGGVRFEPVGTGLRTKS